MKWFPTFTVLCIKLAHLSQCKLSTIRPVVIQLTNIKRERQTVNLYKESRTSEVKESLEAPGKILSLTSTLLCLVMSVTQHYVVDLFVCLGEGDQLDLL